MPSTDPIRDAVRAWLGHVGPGLYGVACSGGADSMTLLHAVIAEAGAPNVVALTIDHGLVAESAAIAEGVARWARGQGAAAVVRRVTVPARASIEAAARDARYAALDALADALGISTIFVGHTARDQAETVLLRVLRGTGPAGLAAIPPERGRFARPLLELDRAAIEAYVAAHALPTWPDPMNVDHRLTRVRVRETILPALRAENARIDAALCRLAASAREWTAVIDAAAAPHARFPIACGALAALPPAVRKRALAIALDRSGIDFATPHLEAIDRLVCAPIAGQVALDLPATRIARTYDTLDVVPAPTAGAVRIAPAGYELRVWRSGDRMRPARLRGRSRKLSDLYADAKIPRNQRAVAVVLVKAETIVWAEHIGLACDAASDLVPL